MKGQLIHKSLLESGLFADAEVHCAGHTWKVHRAILCSRNKWFKAAFAGTFKVSNTRQDVQVLRWCSYDD